MEEIKEKQKGIKLKRLIIPAGILIGLLILSILIEIFGFNFKYWMSPKAEQDNYNIANQELILHDLTVDGNIFTITGKDPYFQIDKNGYIGYLSLKTDTSTTPFIMTVRKIGKTTLNSKEYDVDAGFKESSVLYLNDTANKVQIAPSLQPGLTTFTLHDITTINHLVINKLRILFLFSVLGILFYFIYFRKNVMKNLHITFLIIVLVFGINISIMNPTYYCYDEEQHFVRAYEVSRLDLGITSKEIQWPDNIGEFKQFTGFTNSPFNSYLERQNYIDTFSTNSYNYTANYPSTADTYPFLPYLTSGLGIFLARSIGLPFIYTFYAARIFPLIAYAIICMLCIKHAKFAKRTIFMVALLAPAVFLASAISADTFTVACSIAAVTVFLNMMVAEKGSIGWRQPLLFLIFVAITTMCKVTYAPLCLLILCIPKDRFSERLKLRRLRWSLKWGIMIACGIIALLTFIYGSLKGITQWPIEGADSKEQVSFILHNIPTYIHIVWNSTTFNLIEYLSGITTTMAYAGGLSPIWMISSLIALIVVSIIDPDNKLLSLKLYDKIIMFLVVVISWGLIMTALYMTFNPVGATNIIGVQGRYIIPILLPFLLLFKSKTIGFNGNQEHMNYIISIGSSALVAMSAGIILTSFCI